MRDPHVQSLRYKLVPHELTRFCDPPPFTWETEEFRATVADGAATVNMLKHYPTVAEARAVVDERLRAWEICSGLQSRSKYQPFRFEFWHEAMIDRDPDPEEGVRIRWRTSTTLTVDAVISELLKAIPPPPSEFDASPEVQAMWWRWEEYNAGRSSLTAMAYYCLTVLEVGAGGRNEACERYGVSGRVLSTLGRLASGVGDHRTARKAGVQDHRLHTPEEQRWIEEVVPALIQRAGEHAFDSTRQFTELTMAEFPML